MVRAILDGRKTQTRRTLTKARVFATPESPAFTLTGDDMARALQNAGRFRRLDGDGWFWESDAFPWQAPAERTGWMAHIGYAPGDRLWVREKHSLLESSITGRAAPVWYWADGEISEGDYSWPRPSIHLPRWASRLTLIVQDVRVQRLQEITWQDAKAEGISGGYHQSEFAALWDSINAKRGYGWETDPWVVALTFLTIRANIDAIEKEAA